MFVELGSNITSKAIPAEHMPAGFYICNIFLQMVFQAHTTVESPRLQCNVQADGATFVSINVEAQ
jgi:hypothetical protein